MLDSSKNPDKITRLIEGLMIFLVLENIKGLKRQELQDPAEAAKGVGIMILPPGAINTAERIEETTAIATTQIKTTTTMT